MRTDLGTMRQNIRKYTRKASFLMVFLLAFLLITFSALAQNPAENQAKNPLVEAFSQQLQDQKLEGPLGTLFGDERINVHLETEEGVIVVGIVTEEKVVKSIEEKELQKPSLNVYVDEKTIIQIQRSDDPLFSLKKALDERKIKYKAVGLLNKIKFSFLSVFSNIASLFISDDSDFDSPGEKEGFNPQPEPPGKEELPGEAEGFNPQPEPPGKEKNEVISPLTGGAAADVSGTGDSGTGDSGTDDKTVVSDNKEHIVKLTINGFDPYEIDVEVGDTVIWKNIRVGSNFNQGMVIGVRECRGVRSGVLEHGEEYSYTFEEPAKCTIVDGIWTTKESRVNVKG